MTNAVTKKTDSHLTLADQGGGSEEILSSNMVIPYLLLMQGLSDLVNERKAQQGDMVRSTTAEVLGGPERPVEFIPITFQNQWVLQEKVGGKFEYRGTEPMTAANQDFPWDYSQNLAEWRRIKCINVFALLPSDIAAERKEKEKAAKGEYVDPDKALMPVVISFRSTSFNAGKHVVNHFAKARTFNKHGYIKSLKLKCYPDKNDKGSFYVFDVEQGSPVAPTDLAVAEHWYGILTTKKIQTDDSAEKTGQTVSANSKF